MSKWYTIHKRHGFHPWVRKIPWRRKWQPTPVFLPEKAHGQRSLAGYSPKCPNELDMTERPCMHAPNYERRFFTSSFVHLINQYILSACLSKVWADSEYAVVSNNHTYISWAISHSMVLSTSLIVSLIFSQ